MALVKLDEILEHLDHEVRKALVEAVREEIPGAQFDERALFRAFARAVYRECSTWESVPDQYVEQD